MVKSIIRSYHWPPDIVGGLFVDANDQEGMVYLYRDISDQVQELKKKK
jgi:hypothetical protein